MGDTTHRKIPPPGAHCEEASPLSRQFYIACGKRAEFIVRFPRSGEGPYAMCAPCADHNVRNRHAEYVEEPNDG